MSGHGWQRSVLVAEDDPVFRQLLTFTLERVNFRVVAVGDGNDAWSLLEREAFDFLVSDQQMPHCCGLELLERLRDRTMQTGMAMPPSILCTAKGSQMDSDELAQRFGVVEIVAKPFSPKNLALSVCRYFGMTPT